MAVVALLLSGLGLWFAFARQPVVAPAASAMERSLASPAVGADAAAATAADVEPTVTRSVAPAVGLSGVVLDDLGAPIDHVIVYLRQIGSVIAGADMCCTDGEGHFAFPKAHDTVSVSVENGLVPPQEVVLAPGERNFVELRATLPCIELVGTVWCGDVAVRGRLVGLRDTTTPERLAAAEGTDDEGRYRHVLPVGTYSVEVAGPPGATDSAAAGMPFAMGTIALGDRVRRVQHDLRVPCAEIRVTVVDARDRSPVANLVVKAFGEGIGRPQVLPTDENGVVVFRELPAAVWRVSLVSNQYALVEDQLIEVLGSGRHVANFFVGAAGSVRVVLRNRVATLATPGTPAVDELIMERLFVGQDPECVLHRENAVVHKGVGVWEGPPGGRGLVFAGVAPGRYELRCEDRFGVGTLRFQPVEPFVRGEIDVHAGATTTIEVEVTRRPHLQVVVADEKGKHWPLEVELVAARGSMKLWAGFGSGAAFLPAGEYRLLVEAPTGKVEDKITMADANMTHVLRVPGEAPPMERFNFRMKE